MSNDMLIGHLHKLELFHWFVRAHLESAGGKLSDQGAETEKAAAKQLRPPPRRAAQRHRSPALSEQAESPAALAWRAGQTRHMSDYGRRSSSAPSSPRATIRRAPQSHSPS